MNSFEGDAFHVFKNAPRCGLKHPVQKQTSKTEFRLLAQI